MPHLTNSERAQFGNHRCCIFDHTANDPWAPPSVDRYILDPPCQPPHELKPWEAPLARASHRVHESRLCFHCHEHDQDHHSTLAASTSVSSALHEMPTTPTAAAAAHGAYLGTPTAPYVHGAADALPPLPLQQQQQQNQHHQQQQQQHQLQLQQQQQQQLHDVDKQQQQQQQQRKNNQEHIDQRHVDPPHLLTASARQCPPARSSALLRSPSPPPEGQQQRCIASPFAAASASAAFPSADSESSQAFDFQALAKEWDLDVPPSPSSCLFLLSSDLDTGCSDATMAGALDFPNSHVGASAQAFATATPRVSPDVPCHQQPSPPRSPLPPATPWLHRQPRLPASPVELRSGVLPLWSGMGGQPACPPIHDPHVYLPGPSDGSCMLPDQLSVSSPSPAEARAAPFSAGGGGGWSGVLANRLDVSDSGPGQQQRRLLPIPCHLPVRCEHQHLNEQQQQHQPQHLGMGCWIRVAEVATKISVQSGGVQWIQPDLAARIAPLLCTRAPAYIAGV